MEPFSPVCLQNITGTAVLIPNLISHGAPELKTLRYVVGIFIIIKIASKVSDTIDNG
jgi:hypothetical protein